MFLILLDPSKHELRAVRADAVRSTGSILLVPHHDGVTMRTFELPPGFERLEDLTVFETSDEAFASIRSDFCPSLHP